MTHAHNIADNDTHFVIDPDTRFIANESGTAVRLMQFDHNSETITFQMPKIIEGHDMSLSNMIEVLYKNAGTGSSARAVNYGVDDIGDSMVIDDETETLTLSWLISQNATQNAGNLEFQLRFVCHSNADTSEYIWHTNCCVGGVILPSLNSVAGMTELYPDVLIDMDRRITLMEENGTGELVNVSQLVNDADYQNAEQVTAIVLSTFTNASGVSF